MAGKEMSARNTLRLGRGRGLRLWSTLLFGVTLHLGAACAQPVSSKRPPTQRLAVLELQSAGALTVPQLMSLSDLLRAEAQRTLGDDFVIMSRENINVLLEDPEVSEACTSNCELKVGRAIQAHFVLSGSVRAAEGQLRASLRLHRVRDDRPLGVEMATGEDEEALSEALKSSAGLLLIKISSGQGDGGEGLVAQSQLSVAPLPAFKGLTVVNRFGIPTPLMVQYDEALKVDEDEDEPVERKIELWSKLSSYRQYQRLATQAKERATYWRQRYQRRIACEQTWRELSPVMELSRAVSEAERVKLAVDFLDECGRDPRENPHVQHPALREQLEREREARRAEERAQRARAEAQERAERARHREELKAKRKQEKAEAKKEELRLKHEQETEALIEELSPLELWIGVSHGVKAEGLSYHFKTRLQLEDVLARSLFLDGFAVLKKSPDSLGELFKSELGLSLGYQLFHRSRWSPSVALGYTQLNGSPYALAELGVRYVRLPGWLGFGLSLQYVKGFSASQTQAELMSEANPEGPLNAGRSFVAELDKLNGEVRVTLWADTGVKGVLFGLLTFYVLSASGAL